MSNRLPPEQWAKLQEHKAEFIEAFEDADIVKIDEILNALPANNTPADEDNEAMQFIDWTDCDLDGVANFYASTMMKVCEYPVCSIEELKALLDA